MKIVTAAEVTAIILAGGAGRRVGNRDKGLILWRDKPLIAHVSDRLQPQAQTILISCNRNTDEYRRYGAQVIPDRRGGYAGPLAGLEAAGPHIKSPYALVVACDIPLLPLDLGERLLYPLITESKEGSDICYAHDGERGHYLCAAMRSECLKSLSGFLDEGNRKVRDWLAMHRTTVVDFGDQQEAFRNFNSLAEFDESR